MSLRITALIYMACFACAAIGLYLVKYNAQCMQREVAALKHDLANEKESLHLLNAEWAYLNRPERLQELAEKHLELVPLDSRQIGEVTALPAMETGDESIAPASGYQAAAMVSKR
ncbi:MAG: hypothetical protein ACKVOE_09120 [Rickettsiales bacterium]